MIVLGYLDVIIDSSHQIVYHVFDWLRISRAIA